MEVTNGACTATESIDIQVRDEPNITLGTILPVCNNISNFSLPYSNPVNNPVTYDIVKAGANPLAAFVNVLDRSLPASPITAALPAGTAPGTYTFNLILKNPALSSTGRYPWDRGTMGLVCRWLR